MFKLRHKKRNNPLEGLFQCTSAGVRTLDPLIKSQMLYQLSYRRFIFLKCGCKGMAFFYNLQKIF